ncbi:hypothetical protein OJ997_07350 [Solirubrobacter phytolaccae]|uniref:Uncharacterized protein n=1 Tax=Solirubrobacter phytolaccae TaxID=1404360 RepID=A0A9X3SE60_9ACTN|nr:hypothetical protein [Solirubrobacter phytolaccae]MDA0180107.1 hypothetical protein [Solirubrobacter phytolaccae]
MNAVRAAEAGAAGAVISEAILLPTGVLVAAGNAGVFLLTPDGREEARWDVRASSLTIADDGTSALIVGPHRSGFALHRLDLATHELTPLPTLTGYGIAPTFDGTTVTIEGHEGLRAFDLTTDPPRIAWAEFERSDATVQEHQRSPTRLSAIVSFRRGEDPTVVGVERWTWELPSRRVIDRQADTETWGDMFTVAAPLRVSATTADGTLVYIDRLDGDLVECVKPVDGPETVRPLDDYAEVDVDGDRSALLQETAIDARVTVRDAAHAPVAVVTFPGTRFAHFRAHGGTATAYAQDGRIVAVDLRTGEALANLAVLDPSA